MDKFSPQVRSEKKWMVSKVSNESWSSDDDHDNYRLRNQIGNWLVNKYTSEQRLKAGFFTSHRGLYYLVIWYSGIGGLNKPLSRISIHQQIQWNDTTCLNAAQVKTNNQLGLVNKNGGRENLWFFSTEKIIEEQWISCSNFVVPHKHKTTSALPNEEHVNVLKHHPKPKNNHSSIRWLTQICTPAPTYRRQPISSVPRATFIGSFSMKSHFPWD